MQKLRIKIEINEHIIEGIGKIDNDIITLKTKEELIKYDTKKTILYKENKDLIITLDFLSVSRESSLYFGEFSLYISAAR